MSDKKPILIKVIAAQMHGILDAQLLDGMSIHVLQKISDCLNQAIRTIDESILPEQDLTTEKWVSGSRDEHGKRISSKRFFDMHYGQLPYKQRPYSDQLRRHNVALYNALCVRLSRKKMTMDDLLPVRTSAQGGRIFKSIRDENNFT